MSTRKSKKLTQKRLLAAYSLVLKSYLQIVQDQLRFLVKARKTFKPTKITSV